MKLTVSRIWFTDKSTMGILDVDGVRECYTLEPVTKDDDSKPRAIPVGIYPCRLLPSARFQTYTPHVLDVPGFTAIEIHPGNSPKDTEGCLLVGQTIDQEAEWIGNSEPAFNDLLSKLDAAQDMEIEYLEQRAMSA